MEIYEILKKIHGKKIISTIHRIEGRIDNFIELKLEDGNIIQFYAESSEFSFSLLNKSGKKIL